MSTKQAESRVATRVRELSEDVALAILKELKQNIVVTQGSETGEVRLGLVPTFHGSVVNLIANAFTEPMKKLLGDKQ